MNIEMFKKVKEQILAEPENFIMEVFHCDTAFCIAGWACIIDRKETHDIDFCCSFYGSWESNGASILEISCEYDNPDLQHKESQTNRLFYLSGWPEQFYKQYEEIDRLNAEDKRQKLAEIACARIDHFIATNGRE